MTYVKRFRDFFCPLVIQLERIFPHIPKVYILNGHYNTELQLEYLSEALVFVKLHSPQSIVIPFFEHQSLAKCWNLCLIFSKKNKTLILNDDVIISKKFKLELESQMSLYETAVINKSWSHFFISKSTVKKVGWFDERFLGVGFEDGDYVLRLAKHHNLKKIETNYLHTISCGGLLNLVANNDDPGWKMISKNIHSKYAKMNDAFFKAKWKKISSPSKNSVCFFGSHYVEKLKTPLFYPFRTLNSKKRLLPNFSPRWTVQKIIFKKMINKVKHEIVR